MQNISPIGIPNAQGYLKNDGTGTLSWDSDLAAIQPIGIEYDFTAAQPSPTLRVIDINGNTIASPSALIAFNPLFTGIKRCNLSNAGVVNAWWGDPNFSYTGSNGQCMTRYPMGYYKQDMEIGTSVKRWRRWVSPVPWGGIQTRPGIRIERGNQLRVLRRHLSGKHLRCHERRISH